MGRRDELSPDDALSLELLMGKYCPVRNKRRFRTEQLALDWVQRHQRKGWKENYPYSCTCGWWHLTKLPPKGRTPPPVF